MSNDVVAIDGPAASGKSTVARLVAERLSRVYVDSGSLYRGLTWQVLKEMPQGGDATRVESILDSVGIEFFVREGCVRFRINGVDPGAELKSESVDGHVSEIAAMSCVRARTLGLLRGMTRLGGLVMEGRDIGTVVFPDSPFKFYLEADAAERARRRQRELAGQSGSADSADVGKMLLARDFIDSARELAPLKKAPDAHVIDTTAMTIDEVVSRIVRIVRG